MGGIKRENLLNGGNHPKRHSQNGFGCYDVMLEPLKNNEKDDAIIIEFKVHLLNKEKGYSKLNISGTFEALVRT